ncbi:MAG: UDP-glucose--hexose-1-phosphate uridylyltransferase [Culicoidibacterales bacterium]
MNTKLNTLINEIVEKMMKTLNLAERDRYFYINKVLEVLQINTFQYELATPNRNLETILDDLLNELNRLNIFPLETITQRDLFDTKIMGVFTDSPSTIENQFWKNYSISPTLATDTFYTWNQDINYIRRNRIARDQKWKHQTQYGEIDITINLSKPEKDPRDIALALTQDTSSYPECLLCIENEGFSGSQNKPARQNLRTISLQLNNEQWRFQYSPYVYYNEHCIILNSAHLPMKISLDTFHRMFDFLDIFPHYFIGSNADLPIVGGSILSHDHFQGGNYNFPMENASILYSTQLNTVNIALLSWPLSVIRLTSNNKSELLTVAQSIFEKWKNYSDPSVEIISHSGLEPHNTITPIARFKNDKYELDLVLRNNRTSELYPDGIFHPHKELHHIKKENIGLIEVLGLAILPSRLLTEMDELTNSYINNTPLPDELNHHTKWFTMLKEKYANTINSQDSTQIFNMLQYEIGEKFIAVLEDAGVFKLNNSADTTGLEAFKKFLFSALDLNNISI